QQKLDNEDENDVMVFFGSNNFYIHSYEEMSTKFTKDELDMTLKIADQVEEYDIGHKQYIPKFDLPEFDKNLSYMSIAKTDYDRFLMYLCIEGAKKLKPWEKNSIYTKEDYWNRLIKEEFPVIIEAQLSSYFLVVWDYSKAADNRPLDHS